MANYAFLFFTTVYKRAELVLLIPFCDISKKYAKNLPFLLLLYNNTRILTGNDGVH